VQMHCDGSDASCEVAQSYFPDTFCSYCDAPIPYSLTPKAYQELSGASTS
jgi:hypothetical protein